ncbi:hypothetical protein [Egicoccus halophilus]|uniref:Uncharacterized protein n=1 Tax=Egicoccus halophilus TaxID=1670830 RepID=A0A8J3ACK8_9ACTN|nr:hypothetical protein [Egicoccus halophilus]GGI05164.1 hypothetical protein GCM10011354_12730 [Egicoccus halophilus]
MDTGLNLDVIATAHQFLGYLVALVVLTAAIAGFVVDRDRPFAARNFVLPAVLIDIQILGGLAIFVLGRYWEHPSFLVSMLHPLLALAALVVAHVAIGRARKADVAVQARRTAAGGLVVALVLVFGAIGVVSAGIRGVGA